MTILYESNVHICNTYINNKCNDILVKINEMVIFFYYRGCQYNAIFFILKEECIVFKKFLVDKYFVIGRK